MTKVTGIFDLGPYDPPLHSASEQAANVVKDFAQTAVKKLSEMDHTASGAGSHTYPLHESPMTVSFDVPGGSSNSMCPPHPSPTDTIIDLLLKLLPSDWIDFIGDVLLCALAVLMAFAIWWIVTRTRDYLRPPAHAATRSLGQRAVIIQSTEYTPAAGYMFSTS